VSSAASRLLRVAVQIAAGVTLSLTGCAFDRYRSGSTSGPIPEADWNANFVVLGARGGSYGRKTVWCPIFDYESFSGGWKFRIPGPPLPNLLGYIDLEDEHGFVTPIFCYHWGNLSSVSIGPLSWPVFRYDYEQDGDYRRIVVLGLLDFGSFGGGIRHVYVHYIRGRRRAPIFYEFHRRTTDRGEFQVGSSWE